MEYSSGQLIYASGQPAYCAYSVISGSVILCRPGEGSSQTLAVIKPGEFFGEDGLISEKPRTTDAIASETTVLRRIDGDSFGETVRLYPELAVTVLQSMLERLRSGKRLRPRRGDIKVTLEALTPEAETALGARIVTVDSFPCRIGRSSKDPLRRNDIELIDSMPYQISRSHAVLSEEDGKLAIYDSGSLLGTTIRGQRVGGNSNFEGPIIVDEHPTELILGRSNSPMRFEMKAFAAHTAH
jgi:hypothetical protein